jgi:hypothetical protein
VGALGKVTYRIKIRLCGNAYDRYDSSYDTKERIGEDARDAQDAKSRCAGGCTDGE